MTDFEQESLLDDIQQISPRATSEQHQKQNTMITLSDYHTTDTQSSESSTITNNTRNAFINLLMNHTPLTEDICNTIYSYLPFQHQFITLNPIWYHEWYSFIELILYIIINIIHYIIRIFFINSSMTPFIVFAGLESFVIFMFYIYFRGGIRTNITGINDIEDQYSLFYDELHLILEFFINIPMMIMLLFFTNKYYNTYSQYIALSLFYIFYFIPFIYQYIYYKFKWHRNRNNGTKGFKNVYLFIPIPTFLLFLYAILNHSWLVLSFCILFFLSSIIFVNYFHIKTFGIYMEQENVLMTSKMSFFNFLLLITHWLIFGYFAVELYIYDMIGNDNDRNINHMISIVSLIFVVIQSLIIYTFYVIFNFVSCQLYDHRYSNHLGNAEYFTSRNSRFLTSIGNVLEHEMDYDGSSKFAKFHSYLYLILDWFVTIPMAILLLYYMYNNDNYYLSFYFMSIFYIIFDIWKFMVSMFYYKDFNLDRSMAHILMFFIKLPLILFVFGVTELCINYYSYDSKVLSLMSMIFVITTSIYFCCILPFCICKCMGKM